MVDLHLRIDFNLVWLNKLRSYKKNIYIYKEKPASWWAVYLFFSITAPMECEMNGPSTLNIYKKWSQVDFC